MHGFASAHVGNCLPVRVSHTPYQYVSTFSNPLLRCPLSDNRNGSWERCNTRKYKANGKDFWCCKKNKNHVEKGDTVHADTKFGQYHWEDDNASE